jgi:hypothetical protein
MKEPSDNTVPTIDVAAKRKRRKGGASFSTSKQRKRRELKKKDISNEHRGKRDSFRFEQAVSCG